MAATKTTKNSPLHVPLSRQGVIGYELLQQRYFMIGLSFAEAMKSHRIHKCYRGYITSMLCNRVPVISRGCQFQFNCPIVDARHCTVCTPHYKVEPRHLTLPFLVKSNEPKPGDKGREAIYCNVLSAVMTSQFSTISQQNARFWHIRHVGGPKPNGPSLKGWKPIPESL